MKHSEITRPSPWSFTDYRAYLTAMMDFLRATRRGFSLRQFSRHAGYASPNYLGLVARGKKNLSYRSIARFAKALGLSANESKAFEALVLLSQAKTDDERNRHYRELCDSAPRNKAVMLDREQFELYSKWYVLPIREMVLLADFREDPEWIANRLTPNIQPQQAQKSLALLLKLGLVRRNDEGRLEVTDQDLVTPSDIQSLAVRNFHHAHMKHAIRALDEFPREKRNISAVTIPLSKERYELVCSRIEAFRLELLEIAGASLNERQLQEDADQEIFHVGLQIIPLTQKEKS